MLRLEFPDEQLCLELLRADTEEQVIGLLRQHGYWDDPQVWRPFGDRPDNFSTIGNQSSSADVALVEKLINSVDAVLMGECWSAGIRPNSTEAPQTIPEAVAQFIFGDRSRANTQGHISYWADAKRRELSRRITLSSTGSRGQPSFTIADNGEGQTPNSMPKTLLSIDQRNKIDVHFVQGKFNMGGTGALRFCGQRNLQLVISRRNPAARSGEEGDDSFDQWGFTVVRRDDPTVTKRVSTYTYLAPVQGRILRFHADTLPLFPNRNEACVRASEWGTAVKLYEYNLPGRSHILLPDGLLYRLDILLPRLALPIRLHECRNYKGRRGSFDTTLNGLSVRLSDDRGENLEEGFPTSSAFTINGEPMTAEVYAFKKGKADTYRKGEGIIFAVNGQTHGTLSRSFFTRGSVGMGRLEDSILVVVDCSDISGRRREDLFMNSRDRMEQGEFLRAIEKELESILKEHPSLRELRERRRREDVASKLEDSKPFREVLQAILNKSPSLASLFGGTGPLSDPFKSRTLKNRDEFSGKRHPTVFRFRNLSYGQELKRTTAANMRSRIAFETDVASNYFTRGQYPGRHELRSRHQVSPNGSVPDYRLNLDSGVATLNLPLPTNAQAGDLFSYELVVHDDTLVEPFINPFTILVGSPQNSSGGNGNGRKRSDSNKKGDSENLKGLAVPIPKLVYEREWPAYGFDRYSALRVIQDSSDEEEGHGAYTYYINMDNVYLNTEIKSTRENPDIVKSRWQYGMVLIGMALLRVGKEIEPGLDSSQLNADGGEFSVEEEILRTTTAIAPVLLPLIEYLGGLSEDEIRTFE